MKHTCFFLFLGSCVGAASGLGCVCVVLVLWQVCIRCVAGLRQVCGRRAAGRRSVAWFGAEIGQEKRAIELPNMFRLKDPPDILRHEMWKGALAATHCFIMDISMQENENNVLVEFISTYCILVVVAVVSCSCCDRSSYVVLKMRHCHDEVMA